MNTICVAMMKDFERHLYEEEKSPATREKYVRDLRFFAEWLGEKELNKEVVLAYKATLLQTHAPASVNATIASLGCFFRFIGRDELRVKSVRLQRAMFASREDELSKAEYERLLSAAEKKRGGRLSLLMQTICATGIRVSELRFITAEAVGHGYADVHNKGKLRRIFLPRRLCKMLLLYLKKRKKSNSPELHNM